MRYVAAYLLAALGGKDNPSATDLEKILSSVGIESDSEKLKLVIGQLKGKNIEDVIAAVAYTPLSGMTNRTARRTLTGGGYDFARFVVQFAIPCAVVYKA
ncbi:unnamed protein product, partial [Timema podura]|nr:unnamed protein product [Timema podura]